MSTKKKQEQTKWSKEIRKMKKNFQLNEIETPIAIRGEMEEEFAKSARNQSIFFALY